MEAAKSCNSEDNHKGHICVLRNEGMTNLIELITNKPTVICSLCGAAANSEAHVCSPVPL